MPSTEQRSCTELTDSRILESLVLFSFCRACSSERYSFNLLTERSSALTWGVSNCSPICRSPAISSRSI
uniref:Uncharacterized protein n=1 Tax=Zea mays TaxID=4577 RepID=C4J424_MAIZE|nr:unknown [Zea mays]